MQKIMIFFLLFNIILANDEFLEFSDEFEIQEKKDYLISYNRFMTKANDKIYKYALIPLAKGYNYITPTQVQNGVGNFFDNLRYPIRFVNNLLQLKFNNAADETKRFLVNSTFGVGGIFDLVKNISSHEEDLGQSLGYYGISDGNYLVLPILGPSNVRDFFGMFGDHFLTPISYIKPNYASIGVKSYEYLNKASKKPDEYEILTKDALDLYKLLKDAYAQRRQAQIKE